MILFHNARVWTGRGPADWMVVDPASGNVHEVGTGDPPTEAFPEPDRRHDCQGRLLLPGLHDAHIHLLEYGKVQLTLDLQGTASIQELQERLRRYLEKKSASDGWVLGNSWDQNLMGRYPDRFDVDQVCPDRPVMLRRYCLHASVLNSKALEELNIKHGTVPPEGGIIDVFPEGHAHAGEPTGIIREKAHMLYVEQISFSSAEKKEFIKAAIKEVLKNGVTSVHAIESESWDEFCQLADDNELPLRVFFVPYWDILKGPNFPPGQWASRSPMLSCNRVKLFLDGALFIKTAALSDPYVNTDNRGLLVYSQEELNKLVLETTQRGFRLEMHVIGDRAAESALTALETAGVAPEKRPVLAHCLVLRKELVKRLKERGCVPTIQPQSVPTDGAKMHDFLPESLMAYSYAWKTLLEKGVVCAGSSDAPIDDPKPLIGIYDSIFRPKGERTVPQLKQFRPEECLSFSQAVDLYTKCGAYAAFREHDLGQLLPGFKADFILLESPRPLEHHPEELLQTRVAQVWVNGKQVL